MSLHKLDANGKPIRAGSRQRPEERDGKFHWRFQLRKSPKNPRDITRHFWATEAEAPAIVAAIRAGKPTELANGLTWNEAFKRWQDGHPLLSPAHIETIERNINYLCSFAKNPNLTIEQTTKQIFREWLNGRVKISPETANKSREIIAVAKYAFYQLDLLEFAPACLGVGKFKTQRKQRQAIPLERIGEYLKACETYYGPGLTLPIEFMLFTGVRISEAAGLTEERTKREITVLQKGKGAGKRPVTVVTDSHVKSILDRSKAHKTAFIAECHARIKQSRINEQKYANDKRRATRCRTVINTAERMIIAASGQHVFITAAGTAWTKDSLRRRWAEVCAKAGLEYFVPHELRHTHATLAGDAGFSEKYIQAAMRWDDPAMAKRYVHETKNMAAEVANAVRGKLANVLIQYKEGK